MRHGHVTPNPDGTRARCGGPGICAECSREASVAYALPIAKAPHSCMWCPVEVRDLAAVAYNAVVNYGTARERQKMADLKEAVDRYRPAMDAHFAALKNENPAELRAEIERLTRERDELKARVDVKPEPVAMPIAGPGAARNTYQRPEPTSMPGEPERRR